jgi:putative transposase
VANFPVCQRRACVLAGQPLSTQRQHPVTPSDYELVLPERLRELAAAHPRYGYRRMQALLIGERLRVRLKRVQRL